MNIERRCKISDERVAMLVQKRLPFVVVMLSLFAALASFAGEKEDELSRQLSLLKESYTPEKCSLDEIESKCQGLVERYPTATNKCKVYAALASLYSNQMKAHHTKVVEYARKALAGSPDVLTTSRMYILWGNALEIRYYAASGEDWSNVRQLVASPYLQGLKFIQEHKTADQPQSLPAVGRIRTEGDPSDERNRELNMKHQQQLLAREEAELQNDLVFNYSVCVERVADIYSRAPMDLTELNSIANAALNDPSTVKAILSKVKQQSTAAK